MEYRELGKTGIRVSEIGFGAWAIGRDASAGGDDQSVAAMECALELGANFIDTADVYGDGHSEELVGRVIAGGPTGHDVCRPSRRASNLSADPS